MRATTETASRLSGIPTRTIQRWAHGGRITSEHHGGTLLVDTAEVEMLAAQRHAGRLPKWADS